ncbi:hypothetical protein [Jannaschia marina]|uniref:hypothetical protein n=1 Tax=Jannaschia marina TaxID=2741674 RepID=UPI0015C7531E|nr:hypothetical protein [Jannaschia marina]
MAVDLEELTVGALKDLGRVQKVKGHNDMTRDDLLDALDGPVEDALARWLGKPRAEIYEAAGEAGIEDRKDKQKWELLEALAQRG